MTTPRLARSAKVWVGVAIVVALVVLVASGALDVVADGDRLERLLTENGAWGPVIFVLAFVAAQPLSLPGWVLIVPATFIWPWWQVALLSLAGGMIASVIGFALARWLARDWVQAHLPARLRTWEVRIAEHELSATIGLRLLTGYTPAADWLLGVSSVRIPAFLLGTILGLAPATVVMSAWGDEAVELVQRAPLVVGGVVALVVLLSMTVRRRRVGRV